MLHPAQRSSRQCPAGADCEDADCGKLHPQERTPVCPHMLRCWNASCEFLHPSGWAPQVDDGVVPSIPAAGKVAPGRPEVGRAVRLRTAAERDAMRCKEPPLPILASRAEFARRLRDERVLVVTAETGSGKTTQLPQYCADDPVLGSGLVVCTQPRALAAVTIAGRVADEFDGGPPGQSVGYRIGGGKEVRGRRILLATDAALVRMAQRDPALSGVSVLMVDEAHERSLNTDLVLGIAKTVLQARPTGFHVIIASATIDPRPFLDFFFDGAGPARGPLRVPGRTFEVVLEERELGGDDDDGHRRRVDALVPTVLQALAQHAEGHCLAFLPGSKEVDAAVRLFRARAPPGIVALPLYGSLAPEEQQRVMSFDDRGGALRMAVFCTNVAETSLTVPNVRLVVDTGLAKEARYDARRRITVLEQVTISLSSADQRKGRAGRTAPGRCVRLYATGQGRGLRPSIEPEIMRASLDLVVLQLKQLGHDPLRFPFIDRPDEGLLGASIELLTRFGCLDPATGGVTDRGRLFGELPLDPRMSNFVVVAHEQHGCGDAAADIAAVLTAPGSIFFMGGAGKEARELAQQRVAAAAAAHGSDLTFLRSVYCGWVEAGHGKECNSCSSKRGTGGGDGCRLCRSKHAVTNGLNNKALEAVRATAGNVRRCLRTLSGADPAGDGLAEGLGRSLAASFHEQICELLLPTDPGAGCFLLESGAKGVVAGTSSVAQPTAKVDAAGPLVAPPGPPQHLVVMSVTQLPSGLLVVDQAHPLRLDWLPQALRERVVGASLDVCPAFERRNVNPRLRQTLARTFRELPADAGRFVFVRHDTNQGNLLRVYAPRASAEEVRRECCRHVDAFIKSELERECQLQGELTAVFTAGFAVLQVGLGDVSSCVRFRNPPVQDKEAFAQWVCDQVRTRRDDLKWFRLVKEGRAEGESYGLASFHSAKATKVALEVGERTSSSTDEWGRTVRVLAALPEHAFRAALEQGPSQTLVRPRAVQLNQGPRSSFVISMKNLPLDVDRDCLMNMLQTSGCVPSKVTLHSKDSVGVTSGSLIFTTSAARDLALGSLMVLTFRKVRITIPPKNKIKEVSPSFEVKDSEQGTFDYKLSFATVNEAENFSRSANLGSGAKLMGQALVNIQHGDLFDIDSISKRIESKFDVTLKCIASKDATGSNKRCCTTLRIAIQGSSPSKCRQAALAVSQATEPLKMSAVNSRQEMLFSELKQSGKLRQWADDHSLRVEFVPADGSMCSEFTLFGPLQEQGAVMAKIGTYSEDFDDRYKAIFLIDASRFRKGTVAHTDLKTAAATQEIKEIGGSVEYNPSIGAIEVYFKPSATAHDRKLLGKVEEAIHALAQKHGAGVMSDETLSCMFCGNSGDCQPLSICGHHFCSQCLHDEGIRLVRSDQLPVRCIQCQTLVSIRDLVPAFPKQQERLALLKDAATLHVCNSPGHALGLCPSRGCGQVLAKASGYSRCHGSCGIEVCVACGLIDGNDCWSDLHRGRDCDQYQTQKQTAIAQKALQLERERLAAEEARLIQEQLNAEAAAKEARNRGTGAEVLEIVIRRTKEFVAGHFDASMGSHESIDVNPCLERGCRAMQLFCTALRRQSGRGGSDFRRQLDSAIIAWHGTRTDSGIAGICDAGFDPKRRAGQAYGPGEYFGIQAATSRGYAGSSNRLIVAVLLNVRETSTHGNFCYVVNNPLDSSMAFCLPVLVLSYSRNLPALPWVLHQPCPLPVVDTASAAAVGPVIIAPAESGAERQSAGAAYVAPYRWEWWDDRQFQKYREDISTLIEAHYAAYREQGGPARFSTPPITRFLDDVPQAYTIDFTQSLQIHPRTGFARKMRRSAVSLADGSGAARWEVRGDDGAWQAMDQLDSTRVEAAYRQYCGGYGPSVLAGLQVIGRPERYTVSFVDGTQRNEALGTVRPVRRAT